MPLSVYPTLTSPNTVDVAAEYVVSVNLAPDGTDEAIVNPVDLILPVVPSKTATCPDVGTVPITPTSVGVYVGLFGSFAHADTSDAGRALDSLESFP